MIPESLKTIQLGFVFVRPTQHGCYLKAVCREHDPTLAWTIPNCAPPHTNPKRKRGLGNDIASLELRVSGVWHSVTDMSHQCGIRVIHGSPQTATGAFVPSAAANQSSLSTPAISADEPRHENPGRLCTHRPVAQFLPIAPQLANKSQVTDENRLLVLKRTSRLRVRPSCRAFELAESGSQRLTEYLDGLQNVVSADV